MQQVVPRKGLKGDELGVECTMVSDPTLHPMVQCMQCG